MIWSLIRVLGFVTLAGGGPPVKCRFDEFSFVAYVKAGESLSAS
jgi:hypothetical protein